MTEDRSQTALITLRQILRAIELNARQLSKQTGLTPSQLVVLQRVAAEGKSLPSSLARHARLTQATVTSLIDKLMKFGLVTRRRDTGDRRCVWIELTDAGRQQIRDCPDLLQDRFQASFSALGDWEQAMVIAVLERISTMLDAGTLDASPVLDTGDIDR